MSTALINGVKIGYEVNGSGFPIVLLMGLGGNRKDWHEQVPVFAKHYRTISFDHRGTGDSDKPETGYSISQFADDCIGLLDHLNLDRAHLVGYSMGGRIAQLIASRYPSRVVNLLQWQTIERQLLPRATHQPCDTRSESLVLEPEAKVFRESSRES